MAALDERPRTSVNQRPGGGTDYPFLTGASALVGVVLDFYLSYQDQECTYRLPFSVEFSGDDVTVLDADSVTVLTDTVSNAVDRAWGTRTVYEWTGETYVMRAVAHTTVADGSGVLDPRTCNRLPARVAAFRVGLLRITGNVKFDAGYNIDLAGADAEEPIDGRRYRTAVAMDAVPGAGAGRLNGCDELTPQLRKVNQVGPDCGGNFTIEVDPCFRAGPPLLVSGNVDEPRTAEHAAAGLTAEEAQHAVRFTSDCHPCCECDYFVRTYRGLKRQWSRWKELAGLAEHVRDVYDANHARWMLSRQCRIDNPARLILTTDFNCKTFIGGSFCNFTSCCLVPIELRFTIRRYRQGELIGWSSGSANEAYRSSAATEGDERYAPLIVGGGQVIRFFFDYLDPQDTATAKMRACVANCAGDETLDVTLTVHTPDAPGNPVSGDACEMANFTVPEWLAEIWNAWEVPETPTVRALLTKTAALNPEPPRFHCGC